MPYTPKPPPRTRPEFQELYDYLEQELQAVSRELLGTSELELRTRARAPERPREGMIVQADGTTWNPGEGAGTYKFENGVWKRFGDADHVHTLADVTDAGTLAGLDSIGTGDILSVATDRIVGRDTAGTGAAEQLTLSQVLDFIGSAARGDILVRGASAWARLAVGAADTVLKSNGTDPSWGTLSAGWTSLQTNSPTSGATSDFSNISQSHKALLFMGRQIDVSTGNTILMRIGTTNSYSAFRDTRDGGVSVNTSTVSGDGLAASAVTTGVVVGTGDTAGTSHFIAIIFDYSSTTRYKLGVGLMGRANSTRFFSVQFFVIETTAAIEHVRIELNSGNFVSGTIELVGLF